LISLKVKLLLCESLLEKLYLIEKRIKGLSPTQCGLGVIGKSPRSREKYCVSLTLLFNYLLITFSKILYNYVEETHFQFSQHATYAHSPLLVSVFLSPSETAPILSPLQSSPSNVATARTPVIDSPLPRLALFRRHHPTMTSFSFLSFRLSHTQPSLS
jgi:hypothetical protein